MKRKLLSLCTAGLVLVSLTTPALGAYVGNVRPNSIPLAISGEPLPAAPDTAGTVSLQNLESRLREKNTAVRSLQATLNSYTIIDRATAYEDLVDAINNTVSSSWTLSNLPDMYPDMDPDKIIDIKVTATQLNSAAESMRDQLDSLKPENYEKSMEMLRRQMSSATWQIIAAAEGLYLNILSSEANLKDLNNAIKTLESTLSEMTLRHSLGQVSALTLQQMQATYQSTKSQATSLELGIENMKAALETMLGEKVTGQISLSSPPAISKDQLALAAQDYETSLNAAKKVSLAVYSADRTLEDAKEDWDDLSDNAVFSEKYKVGEQTYQSAVYTHESAIQNFELSFRNLYQAIPGAKQSLAAAQSNLTYQQELYKSAELRHRLGQVSDSALETSKNDLLSAQSAVSAAERSLYAAYSNFERAVNYGLVE